MKSGEDYPVIFFDGVCNLCSGFVQFVIKHDRKRAFRFASLQSAYGNSIRLSLDGPVDSIILSEHGQIYTKSTAVLRICVRFGGLWHIAHGAYILPRFIRDAVYDLVARNRYNWFGRQNECMAPTPELKERFIA